MQRVTNLPLPDSDKKSDHLRKLEELQYTAPRHKVGEYEGKSSENLKVQ
jgi:hypothetical protein